MSKKKTHFKKYWDIYSQVGLIALLIIIFKIVFSSCIGYGCLGYIAFFLLIIGVVVFVSLILNIIKLLKKENLIIRIIFLILQLILVVVYTVYIFSLR